MENPARKVTKEKVDLKDLTDLQDWTVNPDLRD